MSAATVTNLRAIAKGIESGLPSMLGRAPGALRMAADEIVRLRNILHAPLSSTELKLVDKNCDWIAFKHAWNAVMKHRLDDASP